MEKFNLLLAQKRGQGKVDSKISTLIGAVVLILFVTAIAPEVFTNLNLLGEETPSWVKATMIVIVGAGLVFLVWRTFDK